MNNTIKLDIKRFDLDLPLPEYKSRGAAGIDLYARLSITIGPHQVARVPLNIALGLPPGYFALLTARSSLHKKGLMMANGVGICDYDYRGDEDEYQAALYNFSDQPVTIDRGERIVQLLILPIDRVQLIEKSSFSQPNRGGFGSTGK